MKLGDFAQESMSSKTDDKPIKPQDLDFAGANAMLEVAENHAEVAKINDKIDDAVDVSETLSKMQSGIEQTIPDGGLSPVGAAAIAVAVEELKTSIGFAPQRAFSLEGFDEPTTRVKATTIALEDIKETVKKIWDAIVAGFKRAVAWVSEFLTSLFSSAKALKMRADRIAGYAAKVKGSAPADATISAKSFAKALNIDGKIPEGGALKKAYLSSNEKIKSINVSLVDVLNNFSALIAFREVGLDLTMASFSSVNAPNKYSIPEGYKLIGSELQFGNSVAYFQIPESGRLEKARGLIDMAKDAIGLGKIKFFIMPSSDVKPLAKSDISPLSVSEVIDMSKAISARMDAFAKEKEGVGEAKKFLSAMLSAHKGMEEQNGSEEGMKGVKLAQDLSKSAISIISSGVASTQKHNVSLSKHILDYCEASLKAVKEESKSKE